MTARKPPSKPRGTKKGAIPGSGVLLSLGVLAAELGMSRDVLRRIVAEAGVAPAGKRSGHPVYRLRDVYAAVQAQREPDAMNPHARLALARAIKVEDEIRVRRGELVEYHDHTLAMAGLAKTLARWAETAVDVLERDAALTPRQAEVLEASLDRLRHELYAQFTDGSDDDDD